MKKISRIIKETAENRIKNYFDKTNSAFIVKYSGLSSPDMTDLRLALKQSRSYLFVVKNTVATRTLKNIKLEDLLQFVEGPCGVVFSEDDPVATSKALYTFAKSHEQLKVEGGYLESRVLNATEFESLAKLPSKEILRAQVVMTLNAPIVGFVRVLNQTLRKFVYCLDQIRNKKQQSGT